MKVEENKLVFEKSNEAGEVACVLRNASIAMEHLGEMNLNWGELAQDEWCKQNMKKLIQVAEEIDRIGGYLQDKE